MGQWLSWRCELLEADRLSWVGPVGAMGLQWSGVVFAKES